MPETTPAAVPAPPAFTARRLLYIGTGALNVMFMPTWLNWLRTSYPDLEIRTVMTRSAERFVTPQAVALFAGHPPERDEWTDELESTAPHVTMAEWADTVIVHPATFHFTSRFALGAADTPTLLALQCTSAAIGIAPALPPGAVTSFAWAQHTTALAQRRNVTVVAPQRGISVTTGKHDASPAAPLTEVIAAVEELRARLAPGHSAEA
ncbi:flavoprotein [Streptomyces sp. MCA2]|uniref:flavoprotein n=1 Tax=Streptomyces TaxID=1883 RepID=UPI002020EC78|nr:flavoprotein [Streptomyces sp. MCA2]MCL7490016.1 flavoprotein [Streptomyces sp. MCA2]